MQQHSAALLLLSLLLLVTCELTSAEPLSTLDTTYAAYLDVLKSPELLASAKTYQRVFAHRHLLSPGQLQRSLVYRGANLRMRRLFNKLLAGKPVSIGVIGGSISWGHAVNKGVEDWFQLFSVWTNTTFPQVNLTAKNGCVPATLSEYVSMCLNQFVDQGADLVFVEYATNDGYTDGSINNSPVQSFERLLRKLLAFPNAPAVVLMEFLATGVRQNKVPFWATAEDQYGVLAQYYGLPWLSYRNLVWQGLMDDAPGFKREQIFPLEEQEERHPTKLGHRYMADMAIHLVQQTYLDSLLHPLDASMLTHHPLNKVPSPMFPSNFESGNLVCIIGEQLPTVVVENNGFNWTNEGTPEKPKWGFVSWQVGAALTLKVDTRAVVPGAAAAAGGSSSSAHAAAAAAVRGSPTAVGAAGAGAAAGATPAALGQLVAESGARAGTGPTDAAAAIAGSLKSSLAGGAAPAGAVARPAAGSAGREGAAAPAKADMIIWLGYLKSWKDMGTASISCMRGCSCAAVSVDGLHDLGNTQQFMAKLFASQAEECLVEVKINEWARQQHHKFKVTGIMVSRRISYSNYGDFTDSVLMDAMSNR